jgi:protein tyrosine phosphatase (PTP) superfamily phosphohydrolase (DUF442 family)
MNGRRLWLFCALPLGALGFAGCQHCGTQSCYQPAPVVRSAGILPAHPLTPCQSCPLTNVPPAATLYPPGPTSPPIGGGYAPQPAAPVQPAWGPAAPPAVSLGAPLPTSPDRQRDSARLSTPESVEPPRAVPDSGDKPRRSPSLPVGIANFAEAMTGVASGLPPMLEGVDWLKTNGYKTVLQVRAPGENTDGDRQLMERRGLKYRSLELSPKALTREVVEEFNKIVAEPAYRPLFVYDSDGSLAGALWYLHFRTVDKVSEEEARKKAAALGLKEDSDGPHREMWLAVQKYLADQK